MKSIRSIAFLLVLAAPCLAGAADYHVGPGQTYTTIGAVPWYKLVAGDTVYIHYQPAPYHEKFLISSRGTPSAWIRVLGVPDSSGNLPVISGANATTGPNMHYRWSDPKLVEWDGVIQIAGRADDSNGVAPHPGYIEIANLKVQDGFSTYSFTAQNGSTVNYEGFAACIYARSAEHILIRNNVLTNCGQGFYNWTGDGSADAWYSWLAADIVLRANYFSNNGNPNSYTEHQTYTESNGVTIEFNRFGPQRSGALGSQLKDRSVGTVIRYNYIEQSPAGWDIDLVEPQESWSAVSSSPSYRQAFVYGNIIVNTSNHDPNYVHWNEDHGAGQGRAIQPNGRLFFYDNTVLTIANASDMSAFTLFNVTWGGYDCPPVSSVPGVIDLRNNIFAVLPRTAGSAIPQQRFGFCGLENFNFGVNWVSPGFTAHGATVTGTGNLVSPAANDPGFVNAAAGDLRLKTGASASGMGGALAPEVTSNVLGLDLTPRSQYVYDCGIAARQLSGSGSDVGALEVGGTVVPPQPDAPPPPDAPPVPDAQPRPDAAVQADAGVQADAQPRPDAAPRPDAGLAPDAAPGPDAARAADARPAPDAARADAGGQPDAGAAVEPDAAPPLSGGGTSLEPSPYGCQVAGTGGPSLAWIVGLLAAVALRSRRRR